MGLRFDAADAADLVEYVKTALKVGHHVDPLLIHTVRQLGKGGLRRALQRQGARGKRGPSFGQHHQLLLAREMWKQIHIAKVSISVAAGRVANGSSNAVRAYYRLTKPSERRTLYAELARDALESPEKWTALARYELRKLRQQ